MNSFRLFSGGLLFGLMWVLGSCAYEGPKILSAEGQLTTTVHITPPLQSGYNGNWYNGVILYSTAGTDFIWDGSQDTDPFKKWESEPLKVQTGEEISTTILVANYFDLECRTVEIETRLDGRVIDARSYEMGLQAVMGPGCANGCSLEYRFFVP